MVVLQLTRPQLTEEDNLEQFDQDVTQLIDLHGVRKLVINLERLTYLTSHAIGKFIAFHRRLQRVDGSLVFCSAGDEVRQIFETAHLWTYFNIAPSPGEAMTLIA